MTLNLDGTARGYGEDSFPADLYSSNSFEDEICKGCGFCLCCDGCQCDDETEDQK